MSKKQATLTSAQVLLKPSSGAMPRDADITAANVGALSPDPDAADAIRKRLEAAGFDAGPLVGLSFSITAPPSVFKRFFKLTSPGRVKGEIPLDHAPEAFRRGVAAVTFPSPPDFGPGNFS
jgi:hypothetical protein